MKYLSLLITVFRSKNLKNPMKKEIEIIKEVMKKKSLLIQMICVCFAKHSVEFLILLLRYASLNFLEKFLEQIV